MSMSKDLIEDICIAQQSVYVRVEMMSVSAMHFSGAAVPKPPHSLHSLRMSTCFRV
jgi:hypothetical protein